MELEAYNWQPSIQYRILYFLKCTLAMTPYIFSARFRKLPCLQAYSRQLMVHCFAIVLYRFTLITYMPLLIMISWMNSVVYCLLLSLGRAYDRSNDLHLHFMYTLTVYVQVWVSLKARIQKMEIKLEESHLFRAHLQNPKTAPTTLTGLYVYCRLISYS